MKVNFHMERLSLSIKDNTDTNEIIKLTVEELKSTLTQRPGAQAIKFVITFCFNNIKKQKTSMISRISSRFYFWTVKKQNFLLTHPCWGICVPFCFCMRVDNMETPLWTPILRGHLIFRILALVSLTFSLSSSFYQTHSSA